MSVHPTPIANTTDFDHGLDLINRHLQSTSHHHHHPLNEETSTTVVKELFDINTDIEQRITELNISKRRWDIARKVSGGLTVLSILGELTTVCIDALILTDRRNTVYWIKTSFLIGIAMTAIFFAVVTGIFQCRFGNRYEKLKSCINEMTPEDKATLLKLQTVISSIGLIDRQRHDPDAPIDKTIETCFQCIKELQETSIKDNPLPEKSALVSAAIDVLPDQHKIKQKLNEMSQEEKTNNEKGEIDEASPSLHASARPFHNIGQQSSVNITHSIHRPSKVFKQHWQELGEMLGGIYVPTLTMNGKKINNPLPPNRYTTIIDMNEGVGGGK